MSDLISLGKKAKAASLVLATATTEEKNNALSAISHAIINNIDAILEANAQDVAQARAKGMSEAMIDRLALTRPRLESVAAAVMKVVALPDPIGSVLSKTTLENGLEMTKVRVPLGVIGIIYESRPNVTVDAAVLCLKSGNAAFLRGGSETINSNITLEAVMRDALRASNLPESSITLLHDTDRAVARDMMRLRDYIDVLIPRGGAGLIKAVVENSSVPVIETGVGNCHVYIDKSADLEMGTKIILNAKAQRVSVCNAAETMLVHKDIAEEFLPMAKAALDTKNVELRCCPVSKAILGDDVKDASEEDYYSEFLDYILAVKVVNSLDDAIRHIQKYSTHHSEAIVTTDMNAASEFCSRIDSAALYINASTRFTDGEALGFGAEIGISTQKLHARGPMGLNELCSYKYILKGSGQIR
ncbi:MAG: glutamate-5-semialdehyde dehydrogenase [Clostridiaceae bacterium]|nr:glutamate-5-semialdehyde dehydrogenase [Clostridiaceae bacterium]